MISGRILSFVISTIVVLFHEVHGQPGPIVFGPGTRPGVPRLSPQPPSPFLTGSMVHATCYFNDTYSPVRGRVDIRQDLSITPPIMEVRVQVIGLPQSAMSDMEHAMHVHQWGDLSRNCYNAGPHFDTDAFSLHGGPNARDRTERHDGDFGNLRQTNNGVIDSSFNVQNMMLVGDAGILGRSVVLHQGRDDLGRGNNPVSVQTGNSGPPIACCVVGLADTTNWNNPIFRSGQFNGQGTNPMSSGINMNLG